MVRCIMMLLTHSAVILIVLQTCAITTHHVVLQSPLLLFVQSKEIVATHEWQRIGDNDTLPAGLHVKLDLSTGEKWAKLPSDDGDDEYENGADSYGNKVFASASTDNEITISAQTNNGGSNNSSGKSSSMTKAVIDGSGALTILDAREYQSNHANDAGYDTDEPVIDNNNDDDDEEEEENDDAKYLMMHRVMSKLPPEELERFGGLPALPSPAIDDNKNHTKPISAMQELTPDQRQEFQNRMDELWTQRQMELKKAQESLADFPKMLQERISTITNYLHNVEENLYIVLKKRLGMQNRPNPRADLSDDNTQGEEEEEEMELANDIVSALHDLEYLLSDVDNARDFHTLGGWPILVALLDEKMHRFLPLLDGGTDSSSSLTTSREDYSSRNSSSSRTTMEELMVLVDEVRALAALCIGTAVSNSDEFRSWALEDVSSVMESMYQNNVFATKGTTYVNVSALSLLLSSFELELSLRSQRMGGGTMAIMHNASTTTDTSNIWSHHRYQSHATFKVRAIYALSKLLRGNPIAQNYFALHNGPDTIVRDALGILSSVRGPSAFEDGVLTKLDYKFASKVLVLGDDIIMDVLLHGDEYIQVPSTKSSSMFSSNNEDVEEAEVAVLTSNQLVAAFTTEQWCDLSLRMLFPPLDVLGSNVVIDIQEKAMRSVGAMAPACSSRSRNRSNELLSWGLKEVKRVRSEWNREGSNDGMDSRYRKELLELADGVLEVLTH